MVLVAFFGPIKEAANQGAFTLLIGYTAASIVVAAVTLFTAYLALRSKSVPPLPDQRSHTRLRVVQIVLSILLLPAALPTTVAILFVLSLAGFG